MTWFCAWACARSEEESATAIAAGVLPGAGASERNASASAARRTACASVSRIQTGFMAFAVT